MKTINFLSVISVLLFLANCSCTNDQKPEREFYQIKVYTIDSADQEMAMDSYLAEAYLPALKKQGVKNIGVFKNRKNDQDSSTSFYVLIPFNNLNQIQIIEDNILADSAYKGSADSFLSATNEKAPYVRQTSIILRAFEDMPFMKASPLEGSRKDRIYELRSYESTTEAIYRNKVDMFNAGGEVKLFDRLEFNAVFYGEVLSGPVMPNLMYMTTFSNQKSRDEHWEAFGNSPEWKVLKAMSKYKNNVSHMDKYFLYPTEYSDY